MIQSATTESVSTVEPLHNSHLGNRRKWPLQRGLNKSMYKYVLSAKKLAVDERWPYALVEVRLYITGN